MDELLEKLGCKLVRFCEDTRISAEELAVLSFRDTVDRNILSAVANAGRYFDEAVDLQNSSRSRWSANSANAEAESETLARERKYQQVLKKAGIDSEETAIAWLTEAEQRIKSARAEYEALEQRHRDELALFLEKLRNGQSVATFSVGDTVKVVFTDDRVAENQGFITKIRAIGLDDTMYLDVDGLPIYLIDSGPIRMTAQSQFVDGLCCPHPGAADYAIELTKVA